MKARSSSGLVELEEFRKLHREHLIASHLQLAAEEELHAVGLRVLVELLEVLRRDGDGAICSARVAGFCARPASGEVNKPLAAALAGDVHLELGTDLFRFVSVLRDAGGERFVEEFLDVDGHDVFSPRPAV